MPTFIPGQTYIRAALHDHYGGSRQSGISPCPQSNMIMIFSGSAGTQYGYHDTWSEDKSRFFYTGEGQIGDMTYSRGNKAIRDHLKNGMEIHLFKYVDRGTVVYEDRMVCIGINERIGPDLEGNNRKVIIFELEPHDEYEAVEAGKIGDLASLRQRALNSAVESRSAQQTKSTYRARSLTIKIYALARAGEICEGCGNRYPFLTKQNTPYFEVHHIRQLSDEGPDHPKWVAALCPNCHKRAHYANDSDEFNRELSERIHQKE